jgi:hypothetical protein
MSFEFEEEPGDRELLLRIAKEHARACDSAYDCDCWFLWHRPPAAGMHCYRCEPMPPDAELICAATEPLLRLVDLILL